MDLTLEDVKRAAKREDFRAGVQMRLVMPRLSVRVTRWMLGFTAVAPNHITLASLAVGLVAALAFASTTPLVVAAGLLAFHLHVLLDYVDGEVARCRQQTSIQGAYLDLMTDRLTFPLLVFCAGLGAYRQLGDPALLIVAFVATFGLCLDKMVVDSWYRANSAAGEPSPAFTSTNTNVDIQESEWAGAAAVPLDRTGAKTEPVAVNTTTVATTLSTTNNGELGITDFQVTGGTFTSGAAWSTLIHDAVRGYASDYQLGLPASTVSETMGLSTTSIWADAIATFLPAPATVTTIAQTTVTSIEMSFPSVVLNSAIGKRVSGVSALAGARSQPTRKFILLLNRSDDARREQARLPSELPVTPFAQVISLRVSGRTGVEDPPNACPVGLRFGGSSCGQAPPEISGAG